MLRGNYRKNNRQEGNRFKVAPLQPRPTILPFIFTFLLLIITQSLFAQFPSGNRGGGNNSFGGNRGGARGSSGSSFTKDPSRDTLNKDVFVYYADDAEQKTKFQDSSMINFHLYDPVRQGEYEYVHLGNLGSAHRQLVYQPRFHKGFDAGYHNYDLYLTNPEDIPYYSLEKVYSDIYFSQSSQEKTSFNGLLGKPIGKRTNMGIYYKNIRNKGQYTNQDARANAFSTTFNYQSKNQKYRSYLSFTSNTIQQKENGGGVLNDDNFVKTLVAPGRPVNTESGESRYFERDINYTQFYILQKSPKVETPTPTREDSLRALVTAVKDTIQDTTKIELAEVPKRPLDTLINKPAGPNKDRPSGPKNNQRPSPSAPPVEVVPQLAKTGRKYTLKHNLSIRKNTYKYADADTTAYFSDFVQDERGVRSFIQTNQIENTFSIRTYKLAEGDKASVFGAKKEENIAQKDLIEAGATHLYTDLFQEPYDSSIHNLFLFGKIQFTPSERLKINTYAHLGMLSHVGDYYVKGDFLWDTKKLGKIELSLTNQFYKPSLIQQRFISTQSTIWQNDFGKINETTLTAKYALPKLKLDLTANYHLIDNFIYNDSLARPTQFDGQLNILQLIARNQIDVWRFHLQNTVYFQTTTNNNVIRFPEIYSIHRLYLDLKLFKVMDSQLGGEVRLNSPYKADNFQPLTAQFFQQETEVGTYPVIDVFFNFRIQQFRFFLIGENLWDFNPRADFHYNTYTYPIPDFQLRFGFRWLFLD